VAIQIHEAAIQVIQEEAMIFQEVETFYTNQEEAEDQAQFNKCKEDADYSVSFFIWRDN
jgi:hypothetical protein